jgi:hypothetical protein
MIQRARDYPERNSRGGALSQEDPELVDPASVVVASTIRRSDIFSFWTRNVEEVSAC